MQPTTSPDLGSWWSVGNDLSDQYEEQQQLLLELNAEAFPILKSEIIVPRSFEFADFDVPF
jgi:hypothetical protein